MVFAGGCGWVEEGSFVVAPFDFAQGCTPACGSAGALREGLLWPKLKWPLPEIVGWTLEIGGCGRLRFRTHAQKGAHEWATRSSVVRL